MARPLGIDLFAGAGGMSLGFEQAGFDVAAAVEIDPIHAAVHSYNFPNCAVLARSVEGLRGDEIRRHAGIEDRKITAVFGGAPCQGFSLIGQRAFDDPRNRLVKDFVRIVHELDSDYFVFENVKGITVGKHVEFLKELISEFDRLGYAVQLPWKVLNAAHFEVPQSRERLILVGAKKGLTLPCYPNALSRQAGTVEDEGLLPFGPSCRDALDDLPDAELFDALNDADWVKAKHGPPSEYAKSLRGLGDIGGDLSYPRAWDARLLTSSMRSEHTKISRDRFAETLPGEVEPVSRFFKLPPDGVSNTLRAGTDTARGAFTSPRPIHYKFHRCITVREMARLHGFPDWFRFHQTKWHGARQIGNAVPPALARAVAKEIVHVARLRLRKPAKLLALGNTALLTMDMRTAAAHFNIEVPIKQRDRKGAPKPRQSAIYPREAMKGVMRKYL